MGNCKQITNVSNVIDIMMFDSPNTEKMFILDDNGNLYVYDLPNYSNNKMEATKNNKVSNVKKIIQNIYCGEFNCASKYIAITKDNQYIEP